MRLKAAVRGCVWLTHAVGWCQCVSTTRVFSSELTKIACERITAAYSWLIVIVVVVVYIISLFDFSWTYFRVFV